MHKRIKAPELEAQGDCEGCTEKSRRRRPRSDDNKCLDGINFQETTRKSGGRKKLTKCLINSKNERQRTKERQIQGSGDNANMSEREKNVGIYWYFQIPIGVSSSWSAPRATA